MPDGGSFERPSVTRLPSDSERRHDRVTTREVLDRVAERRRMLSAEVGNDARSLRMALDASNAEIVGLKRQRTEMKRASMLSGRDSQEQRAYLALDQQIALREERRADLGYLLSYADSSDRESVESIAAK